jgi:hypothetical protein
MILNRSVEYVKQIEITIRTLNWLINSSHYHQVSNVLFENLNLSLIIVYANARQIGKKI